MNLLSRTAKVAAAMFLFGCVTLANATMLPPPALGSQTLYDSTTLVTNPTLTITRLDFTSAGTLQVSLSDLGWTAVASSLSFSLSEPTRALQRLVGPGSLTYELSGPITLFASVYAAPSASSAVLFHLRMSFTSAAPPVPLPAAFWLLLSGLGAVGTFLGRFQKRIGASAWLATH